MRSTVACKTLRGKCSPVEVEGVSLPVLPADPTDSTKVLDARDEDERLEIDDERTLAAKSKRFARDPRLRADCLGSSIGCAVRFNFDGLDDNTEPERSTILLDDIQTEGQKGLTQTESTS